MFPGTSLQTNVVRDFLAKDLLVLIMYETGTESASYEGHIAGPDHFCTGTDWT